jgi:hypothetical protein
LENFRIIAILESKIERWFTDADINTAIIILERCSDQKRRDENTVRFIQLKQDLKNLITSDKGEKDRLEKIQNMISAVESTCTFYDNDSFTIFTKKQGELWEEGLDDDGKIYVGSKWGKYLRAPKIYFEILTKAKIVPLKNVAKIVGGIITGNNDFFYLDNRQELSNGETLLPNVCEPLLSRPCETTNSTPKTRNS